MARIVQNLFGKLSGRAGELVFKKGKNGQYISARPTPTRKKPSAVQELQRNKMSLVMDFLRPMQHLIKECYFPFQKEKSGFHAAKSYYLKHALQYEDEAYTINYSKALMSFGDLRPLEEAKAEAMPDQPFIEISWNDNSPQAMAYPDDRLLLAIFAPEKKRFLYKTNLVNRADASYNLKLEKTWEGMNLHLWAGFHRPEEQRASVSTYLGEFEI